MIDCRLLMIGNFIQKGQYDHTNKFIVFNSNCYVDWLSITKIDLEDSTVEEYFQEWYRTYTQKRLEYLNVHHIQQSFLLVSDDCDSKFDLSFETAPLLYISLISLSSCSDSTSSYLDIKDIIDKSDIKDIRLYHCFDHCNYVLVCNGANTTLHDYINFLVSIRNIKNSDKSNIVHDVTTLYGYNTEKINEIHSSEKINLILSLNKSEDAVIPLTDDKKGLQELWTNVFDCIGRYDQILVSKPITWRDFYQISKTIQTNPTGLFASRIHVCVDANNNSISKLQGSGDLHKIEQRSENGLVLKLKSVFCTNIDVINDKVKKIDPQVANQLNYALHEVYYSIQTMLNRAFSNYFVLCFYESFCHLLEYINYKLLSKHDMDNSEIGYYFEKIYDLINSYFVYLRTLTASTLHSERRFVQADPHQLTYFDIPPKLMAFYTAVAYKMSKTLKRTLRSKNEYTFLIVPDFKKDIYVESLTHNRDSKEELNLLIIHINEKSMYDISLTTKILAHEIAHHSGLGRESRRKRAEAYMKCILASKICMCIDPDIYLTVPEGRCDELLSSLIDVIMKCLKTRDFSIEKFLDLKNTQSEYIYGEEIPCYFFSDCFIREYEDYLTEQLLDITFWPLVSEQMMKGRIPWEYFDKYFAGSDIGQDFDDNPPKSEDSFSLKLSSVYKSHPNLFLKQYAINRFVETLKSNLQQVYADPNLDWGFGSDPNQMIQYVFREGTADLQMLTLIAPKNSRARDIDDIYIGMFDELHGRYEYKKNEDGIRRVAVRSCYMNQNMFESFEIDKSGDNNRALLFYRYLHNNLVDYFKSIPAIEAFLKKGEMSNSFDYDAIISPFSATNDSIDGAVRIMDDIISEYRNGLLYK